MERNDNNDSKEAVPERLVDRARRSWFPPLAVVGAIAAFGAAIFRVRPTPKTRNVAATPPGAPMAPIPKVIPASPAAPLEWGYALTATLSGNASRSPFHRSLDGVAVGPGDLVYALGDGEIRAYEAGGELRSSWKAPQEASCFGIGPDGRIYVGAPGRVEILNDHGSSIGGFTAGEEGKPAEVTAIKVFDKDILVADAVARFIRRYDQRGKQLGIIGDRTKTGNFMLPNRWLDFAVDSTGVIHATDTGRHLVSSWNLDGTPRGAFGKFGMRRPEDFVGCCNPVNIAVMADGKIVTGEKMVGRVKVYDPGGSLLALIGPENFDQQCTHIFLAVDSMGRIIAADPVRREVKIFTKVSGKAEWQCRDGVGACGSMPEAQASRGGSYA